MARTAAVDGCTYRQALVLVVGGCKICRQALVAVVIGCKILKEDMSAVLGDSRK